MRRFFLCMAMAFGLDAAAAQPAFKGWDSAERAMTYYHNSDLQLQWAWEAFGKLGPLRGDEHILDYGAGDGKISSLLAYLVRSGDVTAVDISEDMLRLASTLYPQAERANLRFSHLADPSFGVWEGPVDFDLATSFCVMHLVRDPAKVLGHLAARLRPGGRLLVVWPNSGPGSAIMKASIEVMAKFGLSFPERTPAQAQIRSLDYAKELLTQAGLVIERADEVATFNHFANRHELQAWFVGTLAANWDVPQALQEQVFGEITSRYLALSQGEASDGSVTFAGSRIDVIARRP